MKFNEYKGLDLPQIAADVLGQWTPRHIPQEAYHHARGHPAFVFYEGPSVTGQMPGIHRVRGPHDPKDVFYRYKTQAKGISCTARRAGTCTGP